MKTILALVLAVFLTGCATDMSKYYEVQGKAIEADNNAVMALAAAAATGNQGAIMALALRKSAAGSIAVPQDKAMAWASILIPSLTNVYGINRNAAISMKQIDAEVQQYGLTMGTLGSIAGQGIEAASKPPVIVEPVEVPVVEPAPVTP
jgi:hypothetical protein